MGSSRFALKLLAAAAATALAVRFLGPAALGLVWSGLGRGPRPASVTRAALSGPAAELQEAFVASHMALMADDWDEYRRWTAAAPLKSIDAAGGRPALALARRMSPAEVSVKKAEVLERHGWLTVEGVILGRLSQGTVALVLEDSRWKVEKESWDLGAKTQP